MAPRNRRRREPQIDLSQLVHMNPATGKFELGFDLAPAYSGRIQQRRRVEFTRAMAAEVANFQAQNALSKLTEAKIPGYERGEKPGEYMVPQTEDEEWDIERIKADYLNMQIQGQAEFAEQMANELNPEPGGWRGVVHDALDNPGGGALLRGLDIISRPAYAMAEGFNRGVEASRGDAGVGEHASAVGSGMWEGITGREKTSFGDALKENDILRGKPASAVGFVADVGLDPSSYVSLGTSTVLRKGVPEAAERVAIETAARTAADDMVRTGAVRGPLANKRAFRTALRDEMQRAGYVGRPVKEVIQDINSSYGEHSVERVMRDKVTDALKDPFWDKSTQRRIRDTGRRSYEAARRAAGAPIDAAARRQAGKDALQAARDTFRDKVGADVMDEIATRKALRENLEVDIKFMGNRIASSRTAGRAVSAASKAARGTRVGSTLARTFRTDAEIGESLHRIQRQFYNASAAQFEAEAKAVKETFHGLGLTKRQREQVARAVETGDTKGFSTQMVDAYDAAKTFFKNAFDREVGAGALDPTDWKDNYLYHVYKNPNFSRGLGSWVRPVGRGAQKFATLDDAIKGGARPLTDVADILVYRLAKSHRVAASHLMMREIAARFGISLRGRTSAARTLKKLEDTGLLVEGRKIGQGAGRFFEKGVFFDQDVAASLMKMEQIFSNDELLTRFGRMFDQLQARIKFLQTAPNPGFHIRNTMSDVFINFLDGVQSVIPYKQALKALGHDAGGLKIALRNGLSLDGDDIIQLYDGMGLRAGFFHAEAGIIPGMGNRLLTGSSNVVRRFSEMREDLMRMAHFIDALKKVDKSVKTVEEAAEIAAKRVRKYNFDYQDLTLVEKRIFRRAVPFYTFMRKNVPLMLESFLTRPGRMIVPTKGQRALAGFLGQDNRDEPLPGMLSATPQWMAVLPGIEAMAAGPENDTVFMQPDMPYNQLEGLFGGFAQGPEEGAQQFLKEILLEQSTPLVRTAAEYATQTDLATGMEQPQTPADALINQFPIGRLVQKPLSGAMPGLFTQSDRPGSPTYTVNVGGQRIKVSETIANYVTGLGFRKVTPQRMQSELRRRQDILEGLLKRLKEQSLEQQQTDWDEEYGEMYGT